MKTKKLFYIGCRYNPQLPKPYYNAYGQLTKADAKKKEDCLYGSMSLQGYDTEEEYLAAKEELLSAGFRVNNH